MTSPERLMTAGEIAYHLNLKSPATVYLWARRKEIPCVPLGRLVRFDLAEVKAARSRMVRDSWAAPQRGRRAS